MHEVNCNSYSLEKYILVHTKKTKTRLLITNYVGITIIQFVCHKNKENILRPLESHPVSRSFTNRY